MSDKARLSAYQTVKRIFNGAFSNLVSVDNSLEGLDRAFAETIVLGVVETKLTLEYILSKFLKKETDNDVVILLMTGVYQIFYMDKPNVCVHILEELWGAIQLSPTSAIPQTVTFQG